MKNQVKIYKVEELSRVDGGIGALNLQHRTFAIVESMVEKE